MIKFKNPGGYNILASMLAACVVAHLSKSSDTISEAFIIDIDQETKKIETLKQLRRELIKTVNSENYERAAEIRDIIKTIENASHV